MLLKELLGKGKTEMILTSNVLRKHGLDRTIYKLNKDSSFSTTSLAWETIQVRRKPHGWMKWIWHKLKLKNVGSLLVG